MLGKFKVVEKLDKKKLPKAQRVKGDMYALRTDYLVRMSGRQVADEVSGFLDREVQDVGNRLTAAVGLSFLKHVVVAIEEGKYAGEDESREKDKTDNSSHGNDDDELGGSGHDARADSNEGLSENDGALPSSFPAQD